MKKENTKATSVIFKTIAVLLFIAFLIIAYLFALNGRYTKVGDYFYFDKWTETVKEMQ